MRTSRFPREAIEAFGAAGFLGLMVPAEFGGMGQGPRVAAAVIEELAQADASAAMVLMMHLSGVNCLLAEPEKFAEPLRAAAAGKHLSTLAFSERGSRSQFWAPVSKAVAGSAAGTVAAERGEELGDERGRGRQHSGELRRPRGRGRQCFRGDEGRSGR